MDRDSTTLLLFALVVLGGTFVPRFSSDDAGDTSPEGAAERREAESGYGSPETAAVELIGRFFESDDPADRDTGTGTKYSLSLGGIKANVSIETSAGSDQDGLLRRLETVRKRSKDKQFDVEFMIATVPDPIDSHVGWESDSIIDAIERGFEAQGFVLDRYYFPWQGYTPKRADPGKLALPVHMRYPGVVLFRSGTVVPIPTDEELAAKVIEPHNPKLYVALLVGETPTRGMHKIALVRALDLVAAWKAPRKVMTPSALNPATWYPSDALWEAIEEATSPRALRVKILGPSFSGSSMSLRNALEEWASGESGTRAIEAQKWSSIEFQIVAGAAQDLRNKPTLQFKLAKPSGKKGDRWRAPDVRSTFHSAMVPSIAFNKCVFTNYLERRNNVDRRQIALLTEGNTVYGASASGGASDYPKGGNERKPDEWAAEQQPIILHYPMQIGRMRAAYERERALLPEDMRGEQGPRTHLDLPLEENPTAKDLLPTFSRVAETSVEAVMEDMLAALGRSGIRYLGIIGSDPMDVLFLARLAHRSCPDAQLFTTDGDLLFTNAAYRRYTDGMLVFSPYPLFIKSQAWMPHPPYHRQRLQFSDSRAQGTFNANCSLLAPDGMDQSVDYAFPFDVQSKKPAVWCSVVSNGALWPVECYPWTNSDQAPDGYNDAVDKLILGEYLFQLQRRKLQEKDNPKLATRAKDLWESESARYSFDDKSSDGDKIADMGYMLRGRSRSAKEQSNQEPLRAHLAELALGVDGFLGFVSLILSAFCLLNCAQYFAAGWPFRGDGPFARWSLLYVPLPISDHRVGAQASCYRFYFFVMLWLAQVAVMSPLLAGAYFHIDWEHGLHPRHWIVMVMGLLAFPLLTIVAFLALVRIIAESRGFPDDAASLELWPGLRRSAWRVLKWAVLAILSAAPMVCLVAWLAAICFPWDRSWCGIEVVSATLLSVLLGAYVLVLLRECKRGGWVWSWPPAAAPAVAPVAPAVAPVAPVAVPVAPVAPAEPAEPVAVVQPVAHVAEPVAHVAEPVAHLAAPVAHVVEPVAHVVEPVAHVVEPVAPIAEPVAVAEPVGLVAEPVAPADPVAPDIDLVALAVAQVAPTAPVAVGALWRRPGRAIKIAIVLIVAVSGLFLLRDVSLYWIDILRLGYVHGRSSADLARLAMFTERAGNLASGVSPIVPALCVFGGMALATICHLRRIRWLCWRPVSSPVPNSKLLELAAINKQVEALRETLRHPPVVWFGWLPLLLVASVGALVVFGWPRETFETQLFKWFVRVGFLTLLGVITVTWFQTLAVWDCLRQLLHRLAWHPMSTAYVRLPGVLKRKFRAQLFSAVPTDIESELPLQQWQYLKDEARDLVKKGGATSPLVALDSQMQQPASIDQDDAAHGALDKLLKSDAAIAALKSEDRLSTDQELEQRKIIAAWAHERSVFLANWLEEWWETRRQRHTKSDEDEEGEPPSDEPDRVDRLCEKAEEFVAIQLAFVVRSALAHLKNYVGTSSAVVLLLLGMLNFYPFQPHRMLLFVGWAIGLFIIGTALWIFVVCNKDEALSHLSGLHPNKIDWDQQFILSILAYGVLPLLVLFSMQFPDFGSYMYGPLEAVSKALK